MDARDMPNYEDASWPKPEGFSNNVAGPSDGVQKRSQSPSHSPAKGIGEIIEATVEDDSKECDGPTAKAMLEAATETGLLADINERTVRRSRNEQTEPQAGGMILAGKNMMLAPTQDDVDAVIGVFSVGSLAQGIKESEWSLQQSIAMYHDIMTDPEVAPKDRMLAEKELRKLVMEVLSLQGYVDGVRLIQSVRQSDGTVQSAEMTSRRLRGTLNQQEEIFADAAHANKIIDNLPEEQEDTVDVTIEVDEEIEGGFSRRAIGDARQFNYTATEAHSVGASDPEAQGSRQYPDPFAEDDPDESDPSGENL